MGGVDGLGEDVACCSDDEGGDGFCWEGTGFKEVEVAFPDADDGVDGLTVGASSCCGHDLKGCCLCVKLCMNWCTSLEDECR